MAIRVGAGQRTRVPAFRLRRTLARDEAVFGYLLLAPAAVLILVLVGVPFLNALWLSFHRKLLGAQDAPWIGLQNYLTLLVDSAFWLAIRNTFVFTTGSIGMKLLIGLAIALVLNEALPMRGLWRGLRLPPLPIPPPPGGLGWGGG